MLGLRRCARGKYTQRVANRIEMVVSRWVCGAVLGGSARTELQIAMSGLCQGGFGWFVCGAVLGGSACTELQIAWESERK